ncbi:hypothetical protein B0H16DRAFT_1604011, partial [Mycena metata]
MTRNRLFPRRRPLDQPPLRCGELDHGRPTPKYALAWHCPARTFFMNLAGGEFGKVNDSNFTDVVSEKWRACSMSKFGYVLAVLNLHSLKPIPYPGAGDYFYLIVMFNDRYADHLTRVLNAAEDPLIHAARLDIFGL